MRSQDPSSGFKGLKFHNPNALEAHVTEQGPTHHCSLLCATPAHAESPIRSLLTPHIKSTKAFGFISSTPGVNCASYSSLNAFIGSQKLQRVFALYRKLLN